MKYPQLLILALLFASPALADVTEDLAGVEQTYKACTEADDSNQAMIHCAAEARTEADAVLNETYQHIVAGLKNIGEDERFNRLKTAERAWITYRDAQCQLEGSEMLGGSGEPLLVAGCLYRLISERAKALDEQFNSEQ
jgi:uncharacterized protein YecT (DUF1311 family)